MAGIRFYRDFNFKYDASETVSPNVRRIVARNPGAFTGWGTSTYIVGQGSVAIVDPGPASSGHIDAILKAVRNETVEHILLTHHHVDHWPATSALRKATGASIASFSETAYDFSPQRKLEDGDVVEGKGWRLTALHTPGHAADHLCFALDGESLLFSGDHVMGWSTSIIMPPDGDMADYVRSLEKLLDRDDKVYLPGHGPAVTDTRTHILAFIEHRRERRDAILKCLDSGDATIERIVDTVYFDLAGGMQWAAGQSVLAHLIELEEAGEVESVGGRYRLRRGGAK